MGGVFEVGDAQVGGGELLFEADDAGGSGEGHVLVEQFADPHRQGEIGSAVAALPTRGAPWAQQPRGVQAAEERGLHPEELCGHPHGVSGVVNIVELVRDAVLGRVTRVSGTYRGPWQPRKTWLPRPPFALCGNELS